MEHILNHNLHNINTDKNAPSSLLC